MPLDQAHARAPRHSRPQPPNKASGKAIAHSSAPAK
jgi:hypothetical protein